MPKASVTVGVFGAACLNDEGTLRIMVNVRADQERQLELAELPSDSRVKLIDMPGGGFDFADADLVDKHGLLGVLRREIRGETNGCTLEPLGDWSGPYIVIRNDSDVHKPVGDFALWKPIKLYGRPEPTEEAMEHPWITIKQLVQQSQYHAVGRLGHDGRTGRMLKAAFAFYRGKFGETDYFSTPE